MPRRREMGPAFPKRTRSQTNPSGPVRTTAGEPWAGVIHRPVSPWTLIRLAPSQPIGMIGPLVAQDIGTLIAVTES